MKKVNGITFFLSIILIWSIFSCKRDPYYDPNPIEKNFTGIIYSDCYGNVISNEKVVIRKWSWGCFSASVFDSLVGYTDESGRYFFKIKISHHELIPSTNSYGFELVLPERNISFFATPGQYDFYPNDTLMNCVAKFDFNYQYPLTNKDTFYYELIPVDSHGHFGEGVTPYQYFTGPFHDTTVQFPTLHIKDVFTSNITKPVNAKLHWWRQWINKDSYSNGYQGFIDINHQVCSDADTVLCPLY